MSDVQLLIQGTPNPNALKFVLNVPVKSTGNVTYKSKGECGLNPLAGNIFDVHPAVAEVYFFDNYITVTQDGSADWDDLEEDIRKVILDNAARHDPDFQVDAPQESAPVFASNDDPDVARINAILDETVRPALQMDGGDIQIVEYKDGILKVFYQGACGSCPSASMGTMMAIENLLRDQFNPDVTVQMADRSF